MRFGFDLGGTKLEGVVLAEDGTVQVRRRIPSQAEVGYDAVIAAIDELLKELCACVGRRPTSIGIGTPGSVDPSTGLMRGCNSTCLNGRPLLSDLESALGVEVLIENDANCLALAESRHGPRGLTFGVILGTGIGGGLAVDGRLWSGANRLAGEWGHNPLDPEGEPCYCGRRGCVETVISGPALAAWYARRTGVMRPFEEIATLADADANATRDHLIEEFGRAIAVVVNILDPTTLVLGGGVGQTPGLAERAREAMAPHVFLPCGTTPRVVRPRLGDSAGVFGAAWLVKRGEP